MSKIKHVLRGRKAAWQLLYCKIFNKRIPLRVSLQITKYCNLKCPYCYAHNNDPQVRERTTEEIYGLLDELYAHGTRWIAVFGGEPLLRKDIGAIITYAHRKGMYIELATNGWFVKDHLPTLKKVDHLSISIDGDKATCDITRGPGTYEKIMEAVELLNNHAIKFRLHAVLTRFSKNSFEHMLELSRRFNVPVNFSEPGVSDDKRHLLLPEEEVIAFYKKVQEYKNKGYNISSPLIALQFIDTWPLTGKRTILESDPEDIKKQSYRCYMRHRHCHIDVDGSFYACGTAWGKGLNLYTDGFEKCWDYLDTLPCFACKNMGAMEQSLILGMNTKALLNALTSYLQ